MQGKNGPTVDPNQPVMQVLVEVLAGGGVKVSGNMEPKTVIIGALQRAARLVEDFKPPAIQEPPPGASRLLGI